MVIECKKASILLNNVMALAFQTLTLMMLGSLSLILELKKKTKKPRVLRSKLDFTYVSYFFEFLVSKDFEVFLGFTSSIRVTFLLVNNSTFQRI
jgi:hypothetical protein